MMLVMVRQINSIEQVYIHDWLAFCSAHAILHPSDRSKNATALYRRHLSSQREQTWRIKLNKNSPPCLLLHAVQSNVVAAATRINVIFLNQQRVSHQL